MRSFKQALFFLAVLFLATVQAGDALLSSKDCQECIGLRTKDVGGNPNAQWCVSGMPLYSVKTSHNRFLRIQAPSKAALILQLRMTCSQPTALRREPCTHPLDMRGTQLLLRF